MANEPEKTALAEALHDLWVDKQVREMRDDDECKVTVRLPGRAHMVLEKLAKRFKTTKTDVACTLLQAAVWDAARLEGWTDEQLALEYYGAPGHPKWVAPVPKQAHRKRQREAVRAAAAIVEKGA